MIQHQEYPIFSFTHTILQICVDFKVFLAKTLIFVDYDGILCLFSYVDQKIAKLRFLYHFQLFDNIWGKILSTNTRYRFCNFSFMMRTTGKHYLPDPFFCQLNDCVGVLAVPLPFSFCSFQQSRELFLTSRMQSLEVHHYRLLLVLLD